MGQDGSVAWQVSMEGRDVQFGFGLALMQLAIGWTSFSIILLSKEDNMFLFGTKYRMGYSIFWLLCSSSPTLSGVLWSITAVTWSSSLPGPLRTMPFDQGKLWVTGSSYFFFKIGKEWHWALSKEMHGCWLALEKQMQSAAPTQWPRERAEESFVSKCKFKVDYRGGL